MIVTAAPRPQAASLMIAATSLGFVLVQLDVSILNVALARIGTEIGAGMSGLQWVVDSYTLALASLQLGVGALGEKVGARKAYVCGFAIFLLGSLGRGIAPNVAVLVMARVVQGCGRQGAECRASDRRGNRRGAVRVAHCPARRRRLAEHVRDLGSTAGLYGAASLFGVRQRTQQ